MFIYQNLDANGLEHLLVKFGNDQIPFSSSETPNVDLYETLDASGNKVAHIKVDGKEVQVAASLNNKKKDIE